MSNEQLIIEERSADIGGFMVGRLIPFRKKRMVGPFIFIDHIGPAVVNPEHYMDIGQHPHIGLSTLTWLFEGEMMHRDSIGSRQLIRPGSVNWMTAGSGAVHTERTPEELRDGRSFNMHGYQIWVALPKDLEDCEPSFHHLDAAQLPTWKEGDLDYILVAGEAFGRRSPLPVHSRLFMLQIQSKEKTFIDSCDNLFGEIGLCIVKGYIELTDGQRIEKGNMLISHQQDHCSFTIGEDTLLLVFGGEPFPEERFIYWNFVSSDREKIKAAKQRWIDKAFPMVEDDDSYIPLPSEY